MTNQIAQRRSMCYPSNMRDFIHVASATVYVATNKANGKCYVGATDKPLAVRAYKHRWNAKKGMPGKFYTAIRKYGPEAFEFKPAVACAHFFDALVEEERLIAERKPAYNLTAGGGGVKGLKFSEASRAKMSAAKRGKPNHWSNGAMPVELRKRLADLRRAEAGRPLTPRRLAAMQKNSQIANAARRKPVICVETGKQYPSVSAAAIEHGVSTATIINSCKGLFASSRTGRTFRYV